MSFTFKNTYFQISLRLIQSMHVAVGTRVNEANFV